MITDRGEVVCEAACYTPRPAPWIERRRPGRLERRTRFRPVADRLL